MRKSTSGIIAARARVAEAAQLRVQRLLVGVTLAKEGAEVQGVDNFLDVEEFLGHMSTAGRYERKN